jgi:uncharacterized protein YxeA
MNSKTKKIVAVIVVLALAGTAIGYYLWNKPHLDVAAAASVKADATVLYNAFSTDSVAAKKNYTQQVLQVAGTISSISKNQQGQTLVLLKTATEAAYINCTMEGEVVNKKDGDAVAIKGICNGMGQGDTDLGIMGDVYLVRCYIIQ